MTQQQGEWLPWSVMADALPPMSKDAYWKLKGAFQRLCQTFPTGAEWVRAIADGGPGVSQGVDPESNLASRQRRMALIWSALSGTALPDKFVSDLKLSYVEDFATYTALLSEQELAALKEARRVRAAAVAVVKRCLVLGKPFRKWSDSEFVTWRQPKGHTVSTARIQAVRRELGYSTMAARRIGALTRAQFETDQTACTTGARRKARHSQDERHTSGPLQVTEFEMDLQEAKSGKWLPWPVIQHVLGVRGTGRATLYHARYNDLRTRYATGLDWLASFTEGTPYSPEALSDVYVRSKEQQSIRCGIAWAAVARAPVPAFLLDHALRLTKIAVRAGMVTDKELRAANLTDTGTTIVASALSVGVPFSEWTDDLAEQIYAERHYRGAPVAAKTLQDVRVRLGYTSRLRKAAFLDRFQKIEQRSSAWAALLRDYEAYLMAAGLSESTRKSFAIPIGRFVHWLLDGGRESADNLSAHDLSAWFATLPSTLQPRTRLRRFLQVMDFIEWGGRVRSPLFPPTKPPIPGDVEEFALGVTRPSTRSRGTTLQDLKAFLKAVYNMPVEREEDRLARDLILLIACTGQRIGYYLNLESDCKVENADAPGLVTLASGESLTKQMDLNATFAVLDRRLGVATLERLQERILSGTFRALTNPASGRTYVHLFSLSDPPWLLGRDRVYEYIQTVKKWAKAHLGDDLDALTSASIESTCHSLRHLIAGLVLAYTKDPFAVQVALDHGNLTMTDAYLQGPAARDLVITHMTRAYKEKRLTGGFFVQVVAALEEHANNKGLLSPMLQDLFAAGDLDEYQKKWSRKTPMGRCLFDQDCQHYHACMACQWQLFRQEDAESGLVLLRQFWGELIAFLSRSSSKAELPNGSDLKRNAMIQQTLLLIKTTIQRLVDVGMDVANILQQTLPTGVDVEALAAEL